MLSITCNQELTTFPADNTIAVSGIFCNQEIATFLIENTIVVSKVVFKMFLHFFLSSYKGDIFILLEVGNTVKTPVLYGNTNISW